MRETNRSEHAQPFFSVDLPPADLEEILRRIDENLMLRPILQGTAEAVDLDETLAPQLPPWPDLPWRLQEIGQRQAPLFVVNGRDVPNLFRRLLNLPLRVFGRKQAYYNREVLDVLSELVAQVQALRAQAEHAAALGQRLQDLRAEVQQLERQSAGQGQSEKTGERPGSQASN